MIAQISILLISIISTVNARCDNGCSGRGTCNIKSLCQCYDNFGSGQGMDAGDCSDRICPYDIAFVDKPDKAGNHHKYAECSGKGVCTRSSGECACFAGYEGRACQRTSCPNACSGHGICAYIEDMPFGNVYADYAVGTYFNQEPKTFPYDGWDAGKTRGCICDAEYGDIDCSKRLCPHGTDVMDIRNNLNTPGKFQIQQFNLVTDPTVVSGNNALDGLSFAITFQSKLREEFTTRPLVVNTLTDHGFYLFIDAIEDALLELPNNVIDDVIVLGSRSSDGNNIIMNVTFTGNNVQGDQTLLSIQAYECGDGCTPKITGLPLMPGNQTVVQIQASDFFNYECGRRGKCDYTTGICNCFSGYTGLACGTITALV